MAVWTPLTKQRQAIESKADELFYGGSAGGGKSDLLLALPMQKHSKAIIFRRTYPNLRELVERSREIYRGKGELNQSAPLWRFKSGQLIEFGAMQYEADKFNYQGRPHDFYGWDEITQFLESQYRYVNAWNRTAKTGQRCRIVATGNPPSSQEGEWVKRYWGAWLDKRHPRPAKEGELRYYYYDGEKDVEVESGEPFERKGEIIHPRSRTFIAARLTDNPYLNADYISMLQGLPEPLRSQMLYGDFTIGEKDADRQVIPTAWVWAAQERWKRGRPTYMDGTKEKDVPLASLGVDVAYGGSDKTVLCKLYGNWVSGFVTKPGAETKSGEAVVALIFEHWEQGAVVGYDALSWGSATTEALQKVKAPYWGIEFSRHSDLRDKSGMLGFANLRAECYWRLREWLDPEGTVQLALPDDPELLADITAPTWKTQAGKILIESKDDIKVKIGRSPDKGDALTLALKASTMQKISAPMVLKVK